MAASRIRTASDAGPQRRVALYPHAAPPVTDVYLEIADWREIAGPGRPDAADWG